MVRARTPGRITHGLPSVDRSSIHSLFTSSMDDPQRIFPGSTEYIASPCLKEDELTIIPKPDILSSRKLPALFLLFLSYFHRIIMMKSTTARIAHQKWRQPFHTGQGRNRLQKPPSKKRLHHVGRVREKSEPEVTKSVVHFPPVDNGKTRWTRSQPQFATPTGHNSSSSLSDQTTFS